MGFSIEVLVCEVEYAIIYGVGHGSMVWFSSFGSSSDYLVSWGVEVWVAMVWVLGVAHG